MHIFIQTMKTRAIKSHTNQRQRYTQFSPQKLFPIWILLQYTSIESHSNLIIEGCLANTTLVCPYFSIPYLIVGSFLDKSNAFVHPYWQGEKNKTNRFIMTLSICIDEEFILTIFCIISYTSMSIFLLTLNQNWETKLQLFLRITTQCHVQDKTSF